VDIVRWIHNEREFWPPVFKIKGNTGQSTHRHVGYWLVKFQLDDLHKIEVMGLAADYPNHGGCTPPPTVQRPLRYFSPHFFPCRGENVGLLRTLLPAGDAREVEIGKTQNVFRIGKGSESDPAGPATLAGARASDLVFGMSVRYPRDTVVGPNTAHQFIFDTPSVRFS